MQREIQRQIKPSSLNSVGGSYQIPLESISSVSFNTLLTTNVTPLEVNILHLKTHFSEGYLGKYNKEIVLKVLKVEVHCKQTKKD